MSAEALRVHLLVHLFANISCIACRISNANEHKREQQQICLGCVLHTIIHWISFAAGFCALSQYTCEYQLSVGLSLFLAYRFKLETWYHLDFAIIFRNSSHSTSENNTITNNNKKWIECKQLFFCFFFFVVIDKRKWNAQTLYRCSAAGFARSWHTNREIEQDAQDGIRMARWSNDRTYCVITLAAWKESKCMGKKSFVCSWEMWKEPERTQICH